MAPAESNEIQLAPNGNIQPGEEGAWEGRQGNRSTVMAVMSAPGRGTDVENKPEIASASPELPWGSPVRALIAIERCGPPAPAPPGPWEHRASGGLGSPPQIQGLLDLDFTSLIRAAIIRSMVNTKPLNASLNSIGTQRNVL